MQVCQILHRTTRSAPSHLNSSLIYLTTAAPNSPSVFSTKLAAGPFLDDFVTNNVDAEEQGASTVGSRGILTNSDGLCRISDSPRRIIGESRQNTSPGESIFAHLSWVWHRVWT
ncbi:hypothetical protein FRC12_015361 [Ceratobasidium sp. 428]|nr:hypothetical protein FRC12_015361 [Ceratobasidium sp. 428]